MDPLNIVLTLVSLTLMIVSYKLIKQERKFEKLARENIALEESNNRLGCELSTANDSKYNLLAVAAVQLENLKNSHKEELKAARTDAVARSRSIRSGLEKENFAPLVQDRWDLKDFRHIGDPVDYIIYDGYAAFKDGTATTVKGVVLLDIKSGKASLTTGQRRIRDAVAAGNVSFATYNPDTNVIKEWPSDKS